MSAFPCPNCGADSIEIPWPNGGDWVCGSTRSRIDMGARQSWACAQIAAMHKAFDDLLDVAKDAASAHACGYCASDRLEGGRMETQIDEIVASVDQYRGANHE